MGRLGLSRWQRLRRQQDFDRVYDRRTRVGDRHLLVFGSPNGLSHARFGLSVSRKHGNAVKRFRLKRLLREAFRLEQAAIPPGIDLVLIPRTGSTATLGDFRRSLVEAASRIETRLDGQAAEEATS